MRCLALAEAWIAGGGPVTLLSHDLPTALRARAHAAGVELADRPGNRRDLGRRAQELGASWVVLDDYHATLEEQASVSEASRPLLVIDDHGTLGRYLATVVLDQNLGARPGPYADCRPDTRLLLGTKYALLRRAFEPFRGRRRSAGAVRSVLVALGGAPDQAVLLRLVEAVVAAVGPSVQVVVATGTLDRASIADAVERRGARPAPEELAPAMAAADLAITAGGSTVWELAMLGVPSLIVAVATNQRPLASQLAAAGAALDMGWADDAASARVGRAVGDLVRDERQRASMVEAAQRLVDGYGADRTVMTLKQLALRVREASAADAEVLWAWANDPDTRSASFSPAAIAWADHVAWLERRLSDPRCRIYLADDEAGPVGQVRFDDDGHGSAEVDVSVAPARRGERLASALIAAATERFVGEMPSAVPVAVVKQSNRRSLRSFVLAGYEEVGTTTVGADPVVRLRLGGRA
jgi:spore coat polysaccharide biosynthesis predicted glycosyltransferase SpsG